MVSVHPATTTLRRQPDRHYPGTSAAWGPSDAGSPRPATGKPSPPKHLQRAATEHRM